MRLGIVFDGASMGVVVLRGRRVLHAFTAAAETQPGSVLRAELEARAIRQRRARVGLSRSLAFFKTLDLPVVKTGQMAHMVAYELERHLPLAPDDTCYDFAALPGADEGIRQVLVVGTERQTVDRTLRVLDEAGLRAVSMTVAQHGLIALLGRQPAREAAELTAREVAELTGGQRAAWLHRTADEVTLLLLEGRRLRLSRSVPAGSADRLAEEIDRSTTHLGWSALTGIWLSGDGSAALATSPALAALAPLTPPPFAARAVRALAQLEHADSGLTLLALGVALAPRAPAMNLLPAALRPRRLAPAHLATAVNAAVVVVLGLAVLFAREHRDRRHLAELGAELRRLAPEVRAVETLGAALDHRRRLVATIQAIEQSALAPLPILRELTEALPQDASLATLTLDAKGVELGGQAAAASQVLLSLGNIRALDNVELVAPIVKGPDKEEFRFRASWTGRAPAP